jgi:SSS family solute:Na+ symporter
MEQFSLETVDVIVMLLYAVFIVGYGLYRAKRKNAEEYFLGGRSMIWPVVGISLFAANISSSTLVGLAGDAFKTNTHVFNYEWLATVVLVFFAIFFMPFYLRSKVYTMPEFLERRYDARSRYYFSFITIVANVIVDTAAGLYVGMLVFEIVFPGTPTWIIIAILAFAAAAYTIPGGLSSVIHTEVIQAVLLILGSMVLTYYCFTNVGGWSGMLEGLEALQGTKPVFDQSPEEILSMVRPLDDEFMPWTGLLFGAPILGFYFWATNQFMVQRVLSAKDLNHGRWGALFAGLLKLPVLFFMVLPGTVAIVLFQDLDITSMNFVVPIDGVKQTCENLADCTDYTYPLLLFKYLPHGLLGLVLAGLLAAMMSSVSATFNSASTLITMDFVKKIKPDMSQQQLVRAGQIATLVLVVLAAAWAPQIKNFDSLFKYLQQVIAYTCPPVVSVFLLGLFWKRANANGAIVSMVFGLVVALFFLFADVQGDDATGFIGAVSSVHFLHKAALLMLMSMLVHILTSLTSAAPPVEQVDEFTWNASILRAESQELKALPWYQNYRILSVILLLITALLVGYFW